MQTRRDFPNPIIFIWNNRDTLLLAFLLAVAVWVSAVYANDPNREDTVVGGVPLEITGLPDDQVMLGTPPETVQVRLRAPESVWTAIGEASELVRAIANLSNLEPGSQTIPVEIVLGASPVEVLSVQPAVITIQIDDLVTTDEIPLVLNEIGAPAPGFQRDRVDISIANVEVSGPASRVAMVTQVVGTVSMENARQNFTTTIGLLPANAEGETISGVDVNPKLAEVSVVISQSGQYRDVAVVVETVGEPASGYERTSVEVDPLIVTLYAENEEDIADIPGFVYTEPIVLTNRTESFVIQIGLQLPDGVVQAGDQQTVAVFIGISPKVKSISLTVPISTTDLSSGFQATFSPDTVEVLLTGPEPLIDTLTPEDVFVFASLEGLEAGTHFVKLNWDVLPENVEVVSINPDTIEVVITESTTTSYLSP